MAQLGNLDLPASSAYAQEMVKHEAVHTKYGPPGRPYEYREYPSMMYRFKRDASGARVHEGEIAHSPDERARLESTGFVFGGLEPALKAFERSDAEAAQLHAEIVFDQRKRMSEGAANEIAAARAAVGGSHLREVPHTPVKPRKPRTPKAVKAATV